MKTGKKNGLLKTAVLIVDDHPMMRDGLVQMIRNEPDLEVVGEADRASEAMEIIGKNRPGLILADISLPDKSGLEFIKDVQAIYPGIPILVISMHDESLYAERVLRAGGRGYIMKEQGGRKLMEAIRQVLAGKIYVSEKISERILEIFSGGRSTTNSPIEQLTDREFEIFQLIGGGLEVKEIAVKLHLSVKTVEVHRSNIKQKLKLKSVGELIRFAVRWLESNRKS